MPIIHSDYSKGEHMKLMHLLFVAVVACTFSLSMLPGDTYAASTEKDVTAPTSKTEMTKTGTNTKKQIPHDVDINTADKELLTQLPGIGPVTADSILQYRKTNGQFKSIEELTQVKGIGDKSLAKLKPYLSTI